MTTAIGQARAVERRLQAVNSRLSDLKLRNGKSLVAEIGEAITPTPTLTRTIQGASSIKLGVYDPELTFLRAPLHGERWGAVLDGLRWRYLGTSKSGLNLTVTLEEHWSSALREHEGPKQVHAKRGQPDEVTRAEFIKSLLDEATPGLTLVCPQLHKRQPVETESQASAANEEAKDRREPGIGDAKHLTMDGAPIGASELDLAETALRIAHSGSAPFRVQVALIEALMAESGLGKAAPGNVLEALEPYTRIRPAAEEISGFLFGKPTWTGLAAVDYYSAHPDAPPHVIAQAVQKSAFSDGSNYAKFEAEARAVVEAFSGAGAGEGGDIEGALKARVWQVKKEAANDPSRPENYWEAIQRLAKDVNWRFFIVGDRAYFMDEYELARGVVRLAITPETPGIPPANVDFDYNINKPVTEVTIRCPVKQWRPPPGSVVTLAGYGPASLGFGDAPHREGQKIGISGNRKAGSKEGRARYIVVSIEVPLTEDSKAREATIKLRKPTAPLPEPAAERESGKGGSISPDSGGPDGAALLGNSSVPNHPELKPGISEVVNAILKQYPKLQITSTTGGQHATNSFHYFGRAVDLASGDYGYMDEAANWINSSGLWEHLTEGIHNPNLSVKDRQRVPSSYWGSTTWAGHANHIHVAV